MPQERLISVDILETGKMAKRKDMSKFDEDQIVMASFTDVLGQIICKTALQWSVSIKTDPVKVTVLNQQTGSWVAVAH